MTSSPYQSSLLRFAISQYRRGRDRHRRAIRQAQSAVTLGASLGAALTVFPVYALVRASRFAGRQLKQSVNHMRLSGRFGSDTGASELIDFSDFGELPAGRETPRDTETADELETVQAIARTLMAVGDCLSPAQVKLLRAMRDQSNELSVGEAGGCVASRITGVASDLETRSLVLILGHRLVWQGLSAEQQQQLQSQIMRFVEGSYTGHSFLRRGFFHAPTAFLPQSAKALPGQARGLVRPVISFWVEVLKRVIQLQPRSKRFSSRTAKLSIGSGVSDSLPQSRLSPRPALIELAPNLQCALPAYRPTTSTVKRLDSASTADWEADVLAVDYIQHPLERLLKWVDRLLLWIENRWQALFAVVADVLTGNWPDR